jgi:hypothetical protein
MTRENRFGMMKISFLFLLLLGSSFQKPTKKDPFAINVFFFFTLERSFLLSILTLFPKQMDGRALLLESALRSDWGMVELIIENGFFSFLSILFFSIPFPLQKIRSLFVHNLAKRNEDISIHGQWRRFTGHPP